MKTNVLSESELTKLFKPSKTNSDYIHGRESTTIEYKESYNHGGMAQYFKTMAAFANADGGYIIFGIGDSPRIFLGLSEKSKRQFDSIKIEEFTNNLNEYFQPEIKWEHVIFECRNKNYGIIYTYPLEIQPCICSKMYESKNKKYSLDEGDIYYRYRGRSQKIKYAELRDIFVRSAEQEAQKWRKLIEQTAKIGISNASLLNLNTGEMKFANSMILMDDSLVEKIRFVKEGHFVETGGDPTLKLVGNIKNIKTFNGVVVNTPKLRAIEQDDIIKAFLSNSVVESPIEFIKVIMNCSSGFQPIYYYIQQAGLNVKEIIEYIGNSQKSTQTVNLLLERLNGRREKKQIPKKTVTEASEEKMKYKIKWEEYAVESILDDLDEKNKENWLLQAFMLVDEKYIKTSPNYFKEIFLRLYETRYKHKTGALASSFRKNLCRLDEVLFFD